jgi:hypothetical protein
VTNADRLREAATKIRDTAEAVQPEGALTLLRSVRVDARYTGQIGADAAQIALWSPPVALVVADLLDDVAADKDSGLATIHPRLLDLADLILGDTPEQRPIKVGDPATPLHAGPNCRVRNAQDWECTEPKGHDGPHIACDTERVVAVWS